MRVACQPVFLFFFASLPDGFSPFLASLPSASFFFFFLRPHASRFVQRPGQWAYFAGMPCSSQLSPSRSFSPPFPDSSRTKGSIVRKRVPSRTPVDGRLRARLRNGRGSACVFVLALLSHRLLPACNFLIEIHYNVSGDLRFPT